VPLLRVEFLFLKSTKISIFGGISKFHLWANFGKFGSFGQFWAKFAALTVVESMPKARLKSSKTFNSSIMNPNATWSVSLES
jgi:succinate-acetate transporter protein